MNGIDTNQYLGAFLDEASDNLKGLDDLTLELEKDCENMPVINEILRSAHTLKGMSATMGFQNMASLTHAMEDRLAAVRSGDYKLVGKDVDMILQCLDAMQSMVDAIRGGDNDAKIDVGDLVKTLRSFDESEEKPSDSKPAEETAGDSAVSLANDVSWLKEVQELGVTPYIVSVKLSHNCLLKAARAYIVITRLEEMGTVFKTEPSIEHIENEEFDLDFKVCVGSSRSAEEIKKTAMNVSDVDVADVAAVDMSALLEPAPEPVPAPVQEKQKPAPVQKAKAAAPAKTAAPAKKNAGPQGEIQKKASQTVRVDIGRLDKLMNLVGELVIGRARIERLVQEARLREFDDPLSQLGRISGDIQELATKLRMVPVSFIFERFPRLVRDLSKSLGKDIQLVMEGQETELDRTVVDEIGDPMVHLIRNSLDHGIEMPDDRKAAGKPEKGTLKISAYQEGSGVIIEVQDDGKGIDPAQVRKKAVERGLISAEEAETMPDEEVIKFVFLPGFSLAKEVTDLSGRGVGMDAVRSKVDALGGQFDILSRKGVGTRVFVRLPLTLAIVLSLLVKVDNEVYAMPLENVEETILVKKENMRTLHGAPATLLRGEVLSLYSLANALGTPKDVLNRSEHPVVVVKTGKNRIGFIVDELIGQQEIVIKSLGRFLSKIKGIAGATILGDGNVALILDVGSLAGNK